MSKLLDATCVDAFETALDEIVDSEAVLPLIRFTEDPFSVTVRTAKLPCPEWGPDSGDVFGFGQLDPFEYGRKLTLVALVAGVDHPRFEEPPHSPLELSPTVPAPSGAMTRLIHARLPAVITQCLLGGLQAHACAQAIEAALSAGQTLPLWLARTLMERWTRGLRHLLRLLASVAGDKVPFEIVPRYERFDLAEAESRAQQARERAKRTRDVLSAMKM